MDAAAAGAAEQAKGPSSPLLANVPANVQEPGPEDGRNRRREFHHAMRRLRGTIEHGGRGGHQVTDVELGAAVRQLLGEVPADAFTEGGHGRRGRRGASPGRCNVAGNAGGVRDGEIFSGRGREGSPFKRGGKGPHGPCGSGRRDEGSGSSDREGSPFEGGRRMRGGRGKKGHGCRGHGRGGRGGSPGFEHWERNVVVLAQ